MSPETSRQVGALTLHPFLCLCPVTATKEGFLPHSSISFPPTASPCTTLHTLLEMDCKPGCHYRGQSRLDSSGSRPQTPDLRPQTPHPSEIDSICDPTQMALPKLAQISRDTFSLGKREVSPTPGHCRGPRRRPSLLARIPHCSPSRLPDGARTDPAFTLQKRSRLRVPALGAVKGYTSPCIPMAGPHEVSPQTPHNSGRASTPSHVHGVAFLVTRSGQ